MADEKFTFSLNAPAVKAAVDSGDIELTDDKVKVSAKASPNGKELLAEYQHATAKSYRGALAMCGGSEEDVLYFFNYAHDMSVRAPIRQRLIGEAEGPEKAITKASKALVDAGIYDTEEEARVAVIAQRKAKGLDS